MPSFNTLKLFALLFVSVAVFPGANGCGGGGGGGGTVDPSICTSDNTCAAFHSCINNECVPDQEPVCSASNPCASGFSCISDECVEDVVVDPDTLGENCGGIAGVMCDAGQICDMSETSCGSADEFGTCVVDEPMACTREYAPVCGCDGVTYGNDCTRRAAYIALDRTGPCETAGINERCGGFVGTQCDAGLVCDLSGHSACGTDLGGNCVADEDTMCTMQYDPVCGCNGTTYGNDCMREAAYVAFDHDGTCQ